ncbi:unnamed protein product [Ceutorhynchus assimilis]|uniref:RNA helicase n=1 Tax=Ceutorhynchus assimilis TaxID=467358 RepID=A0A9N9MYR3_9CUCU|nr:unnamed protein product [Ceutorhynchus assimilis]
MSGRSWRGRRAGRQRHSGEASTSRHSHSRPPGLRGREIGLWYRDQGRRGGRSDKSTRDDLNTKPLSTILISQNKKNAIEQLLDETSNLHPTSSSDKSGSYKHLEETEFKHEFLKHKGGSIIDKLKSIHESRSKFKNIIEDDRLLLDMQRKESSSNYKKMLEFRSKLPSMKMKDEILNLIEHNQVTVISGETGCGKTTQVAQFILDDFIKKSKGSECKIICTQPRRISAISVAERVACERDEKLGESVGFQIRLEKMMPREKGCILYCTTGVLLKLMEGNPGLHDVSHVILDEIHERDVMTDFMITLLKDVIKYRNDLKVILMSATLNSEAFSKYYNNAPHLNIPGFTYPVQEYFLEDALALTGFKFDEYDRTSRNKSEKYQEWLELFGPYFRQLAAEGKYCKSVITELSKPQSEELNIFLIFALIRKICENFDDNGAILVFVPGFGEIQKICNKIEESIYFPRSKYIVIPLHSQLPTTEQKQIFNPAPRGMRKIIVSTSIAETSITIDDVTTVIDCGYIKISNLDSETGIETLQPEFVSQANAAQRKGRAGRVKAGVCFHLVNKYRYDLLDRFLKPEVLRKRLDDVILQLKMLQLGDAEPFLGKLMDPPEPQSVQSSVYLLKRLGALDEEEGLTPLGYHMAKISVSAQCSKMLILASLFSCIDPVLSVAATLSFKDAYHLNLSDAKDADKKRFELSKGSNSDHMTMHYAIRGFEDANRSREFCHRYYLSWPILKMLIDMKKQLAQQLFDMKFTDNSNPRHFSNNYNSDNTGLVKAIISAGLYPNVAILANRRKYTSMKSITNETMKFHMKSVLCQMPSYPSNLLVYHNRIKTASLCVHDATIIFPLPIVFFGDQFKIHNDENDFVYWSVS